MKAVLPALLAAASLALLAACDGGKIDPNDAPATGVSTVAVKSMTFSPRMIEAPTGTTVTWRLADGDTPHDVKGDGFASAVIRSGTVTHAFDRPGTYAYHGTLHGQMKGRVIVPSWRPPTLYPTSLGDFFD